MSGCADLGTAHGRLRPDGHASVVANKERDVIKADPADRSHGWHIERILIAAIVDLDLRASQVDHWMSITASILRALTVSSGNRPLRPGIDVRALTVVAGANVDA